MSDEAFRARVRAALAAPDGGRLAAMFPAPLVTAIVAGGAPEESEQLEAALDELTSALHTIGVPRGRQFVLLGSRLALSDAGAPPTLARLRARVGIPVLGHDPHGAHFLAGTSDDGHAFELDDELREAEALIVVGPAFAGADGREGGVGLLCPGVVSPRTRAAWEAARARSPGAADTFSLALERCFPVDLALLWDRDGAVGAGEGRARFRALAGA